MKLTCVLIVALLFLTACQLITADYSRDDYRAVMGLGRRNSKDSRDCQESGQGCTGSPPCCPGLSCSGTHAGGMCVG
uniref:O-superfamily conotoxin Br7.10 n=1 Tax=Conus brunneus TaxID=101289 RepID=M1F2K6_CONBR|nr:O-superfamily conotoxin Br7.10 precursor [Conus brunneus]